MAIVAWSLKALAIGVFPAKRHDGLPFNATDVGRQALALTSIGCKAALVEVRADWKFFKEVFNLAGWNTRSGLCWKCSVGPDTLRDVDSSAPWRRERRSHWQVLATMRGEGRVISPIFSAPFVHCGIFRFDWLHAVDQGVAADFLGNLFMLVASKLPGASEKERTRALWARIQEWYSAHSTADRLQDLVPGMLRKPRSAPKLRSSAAQCRALVPFGAAVAQEVLGDLPLEVAAKVAAEQLGLCYRYLSSQEGDVGTALRAASIRFAAQYVALERYTGMDRSWRVKPKLHMFLELCSEGGRPTAHWTYRDEDFGGVAARLVRRRGGLLRPGPTSAGLLARCKAKAPLTRVLRG